MSTRQPSNVRRRSPRTVKSCGPDARCWRQVGGGAFTPTGVRRRKTSARRRWQQSSSHRGEHEAAVKTIRAGKAWLLQAEPVVQPCAFLCARIAGASRRPAFPAPSAFMRAESSARLGHFVPRECDGMSAVRKLNCVAMDRHCERSEAIQNLAAERLWIASSRSLSSRPPKAGPVGSSQ